MESTGNSNTAEQFYIELTDAFLFEMGANNYSNVCK